MEALFCRFPKTTYPSFFAHNKLGPRTIAILLGVILLTSLFCASFAKNLIKYLQKRNKELNSRNWREFLSCWKQLSKKFNNSKGQPPTNQKYDEQPSCLVTGYWGSPHESLKLNWVEQKACPTLTKWNTTAPQQSSCAASPQMLIQTWSSRDNASVICYKSSITLVASYPGPEYWKEKKIHYILLWDQKFVVSAVEKEMTV